MLHSTETGQAVDGGQVDQLVDRLTTLISALNAICQNDGVSLFHAHTKGHPGEQATNDDLPFYVFRLLTARRTLHCLTLALGYLNSEQGASIYQSVKEIVLLLLNSGTGLVYLGCKAPAVNGLVEMLNATSAVWNFMPFRMLIKPRLMIAKKPFLWMCMCNPPKASNARRNRSLP